MPGTFASFCICCKTVSTCAAWSSVCQSRSWSRASAIVVGWASVAVRAVFVCDINGHAKSGSGAKTNLRTKNFGGLFAFFFQIPA